MNLPRLPLSTSYIVGGNLAVLLGVWFLNWSTAEIILGFWVESLIIGIFTVIKMTTARGSYRNKKEVAMTINGKYVEPTRKNTVLFFIFHFGMFMTIHLIFLVRILENNFVLSEAYAAIGLMAGSLLISHLCSYWYNWYQQDEMSTTHYGDLVSTPYMRVIPMHLALIFGYGLVGSMTILLLVFKIFADVLSHVAEHKKPGRSHSDLPGVPKGQQRYA